MMMNGMPMNPQQVMQANMVNGGGMVMGGNPFFTAAQPQQVMNNMGQPNAQVPNTNNQQQAGQPQQTQQQGNPSSPMATTTTQVSL